MSDITLTLRFPIDPPNTQQAIDAINSSLKNVGVTVGDVSKGHQQLQKETGKLTGFIKEQRAENRQQNFLLGESRQAIGALSLGITAFGAVGSASMKKVTDTVGTGLIAFQGFDFLLASLGVSGPWGIAIAGAAALATALIPLIRNTEEEAKKAKELNDRLSEFGKTMDTIAGKMDDWNEKTIEAQRTAFSEELNMVEERLKIYSNLVEAKKRGDKEIIISEDEAAKAGISINELMQFKGQQLEDEIIRLQKRAHELGTQLNAIPNVVTALKPDLTGKEASSVNRAIIDSDLMVVDSAKKKGLEIKKVNESLTKSGKDLSNSFAEDINAEIEGWKMLSEQYIMFGAQQYDAQKNLGLQMNQLLNELIRREIAKAVITYLASLVPILGPAAPFVLGGAGLAMQALLESIIPKFAGGGAVPGTGNSDSVLALLTPGERVMRKSVSQENGSFLDAMNAGLIRINRFQNGGGVGSFVATPTSGGGNNSMAKEFAKVIRKEFAKIKFELNVFAQNDSNKYTKLTKEMSRGKTAIAW